MSSKRNRYSSVLPRAWITPTKPGTPRGSLTPAPGSPRPESVGDPGQTSATPIPAPATPSRTIPGEAGSSNSRTRYTRNLPSSWTQAAATAMPSASRASIATDSEQVRRLDRINPPIHLTSQAQQTRLPFEPPKAPTQPTFPEARWRLGRSAPAPGSSTTHSPNSGRDLGASPPTLSPTIPGGLSSTSSPNLGRDLPARAPTISPSYSDS